MSGLHIFYKNDNEYEYEMDSFSYSYSLSMLTLSNIIQLHVPQRRHMLKNQTNQFLVYPRKTISKTLQLLQTSQK